MLPRLALAPLVMVAAGLVASCAAPAKIDGQSAAPAQTESAADSAAAAPTTTTTTTPPPPSPPPKPSQVLTGKGDDVVKITDPGPGVVLFECPKCTGNTVLESNGREGLLVNTIGAYSGKRWINIDDGSRTTQFTITAKGSWKLTVGGFDLATPIKVSEAMGKGDDVIVMLIDGTTGIVSYEGSGNFAVEVLSMAGPGGVDLAVNEIGSYAGTVPMNLPGLVQVTAEGPWLIVAGT